MWRLIGSFYLHANHVGGDLEYTGLIMPNTLLTRSDGVSEGWGESYRKQDRERERKNAVPMGASSGKYVKIEEGEMIVRVRNGMEFGRKQAR